MRSATHKKSIFHTHKRDPLTRAVRSPVVATIEPGATLRFNLDFCPVATPPVDLGQPSVASLGLPKKGTAEGEEGEEEEAAAAAEEAAAAAAAAAEGTEEEEEDEVDEEGNVVVDEDGNPVKKKKTPPADPNALTAEEEALRVALLVEESESCEEGEAWSKHATWQLPIFVKGAALMHLQVQTTTVQPLIVGLLNQKKLVATVSKDGTAPRPPLRVART